MKRRNLSLLMSVCAAFAFFAICSVELKAQTQIFVPPVELYKFRVSNTNLGSFLTPNYSEGVNRGYTFESVVGYIHVPCPPNVPCLPNVVPTNPNLRPVYRYRVVQGSRTYFYHGMYTVPGGSPGYYFEGVIGYMYDQALNQATVQTIFGGTQTFPLYKVKGCYSQSKGYYYGKLSPYGSTPGLYLFVDPPPANNGFDCTPYHGTVGGGIFSIIGTAPFATRQISESYNWAEFNAATAASGGASMDENTDYPVEIFEEVPPPTCNPTNWELNACARNDGWWDYESCSCQSLIIY